MNYFTVMMLRLAGTVILVVLFGILGDPTLAVIAFIILMFLLGRSKS